MMILKNEKIPANEFDLINRYDDDFCSPYQSHLTIIPDVHSSHNNPFE